MAIEQPDFVTSDDPWFRPVDLCHGDDGALYVADFYNRIIGHYEVPLDHPGRDRERGRIWRIVRSGKTSAPSPIPPRGAMSDPVAALGDEDPFVRRRAASELQMEPRAEGFGPLLEALAATPGPDTHLGHVLRMAVRSHLTIQPDL